MKILISGGHLTPALAMIDYIQAHHRDDEIVFVGRQYSQDKIRQPSQEQVEVTQRQVKFVPFSAPRLTRNRGWWRLLTLPFTLVKSVSTALKILKLTKPDVMLSFGGYVAVPLAIAAWLHGVPIITHEQTRSAGFANQLIAKLAKYVAITHPDSKQFFSQQKIVVTGNPLRPEALAKVDRHPHWINHAPSQPILMISCGNQGSHAINQAVAKILPQLLSKWTIIHLVGNPTSTFDDLAELSQVKAQLSESQQQQYFLRPWVSGADLSWLLTHAQGALARAGANTVQELTVRHIPTLFIPLPFAHRQEQLKNVQNMIEHGQALLLDQRDLTTDTLLAKLITLYENRHDIKTKLAQLSVITDADRQLYNLLTKVFGHAT